MAMQITDTDLMHLLHGAEWSLHCVSPLAPAALLAPVSGHPMLQGLRLRRLRTGGRDCVIRNEGPNSVTSLLTAIAPGSWRWEDGCATPDPAPLWSLQISTDWRMGQNRLGEDPWAFLGALAARTEALVAVESGRSPGVVRHLVPGFASDALGLSKHPPVISDGDAGFDAAPLRGLTGPEPLRDAPDLSTRHSRSAAAMIALLHDASLGPVLPPV